MLDLKDIGLGLLFTKNPRMTDYWPAYRFLKSNDDVCPPLESTIYRANSTAVAWISILSFTKIDSDLRNISPLNSPASDVLNFKVKFAYCCYGITKLLGSIVKMGPWLWLNYIFPGAFPIFLRRIDSLCYFPHLMNPKFING
jgi:hypothetical protein